jgi:predicted negative regulator of RcsB-dependent stress response
MGIGLTGSSLEHTSTHDLQRKEAGFVARAISARAAGGRGRVIALHRMKGEVILIAAGSLDEAEAAFKSAIAIARRQRAKSFERRASIRLARLLAQQGKRDEAHSMLSESTAGSPKASTPPT